MAGGFHLKSAPKLSNQWGPPLYYNWKSKYGGIEASDLKRIKDMERELNQFKRMYAELALENRALKDLIEKKL